MADSSNFSIPTVGALSLPPSLDPSLRPNLHCFAIPSEDQFTKLGPEIEQFDATIDGKQHRLFCTEEPGLGNSFWFGVETAKGTKDQMVVVSRSEKPEEFSRRLWYLNLEEDTIQVVGKDAGEASEEEMKHTKRVYYEEGVLCSDTDCSFGMTFIGHDEPLSEQDKSARETNARKVLRNNSVASSKGSNEDEVHDEL